jgi:hypothetical protein
MYNIKQRFELYKYSHPHLTRCWLAYLEREPQCLEQCEYVLCQLATGRVPDVSRADIIRLLLYKNTT